MRWLPLLYLAVAATTAAALLPTALRPPAQQPNQTAELSPDAPPDEDQQAIVSSLNRATSGVQADPGGGPGGGQPALTTVAPPPPPPTTLVPRACPNGVGDPPRQVESVLSPPCAAPWSGDNGGSTSKGVTGTEIRIGIRGAGKRGDGTGNCDQNGSVDTLIRNGNSNGNVRHWHVIQQYVNNNFQLYGRRVSFYCVEPESTSPSDESAAVVLADEQYRVFATNYTYELPCAEYARRKVIAFCSTMPESFHQANDPYTWTSWPGGADVAHFATEYVCKKLAGKVASFGGNVNGKPRKFAMIAWDDRGIGDDARLTKRLMKEQCGVELQLILVRASAFWGGSATSDAEINQAATKAKAEGATTVFLYMDSIGAIQVTNSAEANAYSPEWFASDGRGAISTNAVGGLLNPNQWQHAVGLAGRGPEVPMHVSECGRAYRTIDQANTPRRDVCIWHWNDMMLLIAGIQQAGPNLNPQTFKRGLLSLGFRHWHQSTALGGGFAPDRHTYPNSVTEIWWDVDAQDPSGAAVAGAYKYLYNGHRFCHGELTSEFRAFEEGVVLPDDYALVPTSPFPTCAPLPP